VANDLGALKRDLIALWLAEETVESAEAIRRAS
jgi:NTP pyrophosphatase (non-canonical NTP hydrolase)